MEKVEAFRGMDGTLHESEEEAMAADEVYVTERMVDKVHDVLLDSAEFNALSIAESTRRSLAAAVVRDAEEIWNIVQEWLAKLTDHPEQISG